MWKDKEKHNYTFVNKQLLYTMLGAIKHIAA